MPEQWLWRWKKLSRVWVTVYIPWQLHQFVVNNKESWEPQSIWEDGTKEIIGVTYLFMVTSFCNKIKKNIENSSKETRASSLFEKFISHFLLKIKMLYLGDTTSLCVKLQVSLIKQTFREKEFKFPRKTKFWILLDF